MFCEKTRLVDWSFMYFKPCCGNKRADYHNSAYKSRLQLRGAIRTISQFTRDQASGWGVRAWSEVADFQIKVKLGHEALLSKYNIGWLRLQVLQQYSTSFGLMRPRISIYDDVSVPIDPINWQLHVNKTNCVTGEFNILRVDMVQYFHVAAEGSSSPTGLCSRGSCEPSFSHPRGKVSRV